jgi:hypothetical protein
MFAPPIQLRNSPPLLLFYMKNPKVSGFGVFFFKAVLLFLVKLRVLVPDRGNAYKVSLGVRYRL